MARRGSLLAVGAVLALLALPGSALAETFEGQTVQGKPVVIETRPNGELRKGTWRWKTKECDEPGISLRTQFTRLRTPKRSKPGYFKAKGTYRVRFSDSKVRFEVSSTGRQRGSRRWAGSFKAKAFVDLNDGPRVTCKLRRIDWAAKL
ncbi:MAG: hypothetical protein K0R88_950 [Solirubrobacterales bacterium]|nr:hypothetical protein [Solirubrobacterales bacterium]